MTAGRATPGPARSSRGAAALVTALVLGSGCRGGAPGAGEGGAAATGAPGPREAPGVPPAAPTGALVGSPRPPDAPAELLAAVERAESRRRPGELPPGALESSAVSLRRAATRALARTEHPASRPALAQRLGDDDPEVVAWAAAGLGALCADAAPATVRRVALRLARGPLPDPEGAPLSPSAELSLALALARCATPEAEAVLRAGLEVPGARARSSAEALTRLAERRGTLEDRTLVRLLEHAVGPAAPAAALAPFGALTALPEGVSTRLVEVVRGALGAGGSAGPLALRALAAAGGAGERELRRITADAARRPAERALAVSLLARDPERARVLLPSLLGAELASALGPDPQAPLDGAASPLLAALRLARGPLDPAPTVLQRAAALALPGPPGETARRRALRCAALGLLGAPPLAARCDGEVGSREGGLAELRALADGPASEPSLARVHALARGAHPAVRRAALALLAARPDLAAPPEIFARALAASSPGVVAEAARALARRPELARGPAADGGPDGRGALDAGVLAALAGALGAPRAADQIETRVALADAARSLGALSLLPGLEALCSSRAPGVRRATAAARAALGARPADCADPSPGPELPLARRGATVTFVTESGRFGVALDPSLAPRAVARLLELARGGFYAGQVVHRVRPGGVVQLGDPVGDGSGGAGRDPVPCETGPVPVPAYAVGMALAGRDSGSSQLFVTLGPAPGLAGDYALVGTADREVEDLVEGERILSVEVRD